LATEKLDLLILKTLELEPRHGYGIGQRIEQVSLGVRIALGARSQLVGWVAAGGLRLLGGGALLGLLAAWPLTGVVASLLYGVQPTDPTTVATVVVVLVVVGSIAMCLPSWRATQVDPVAVLRRG